MSAGTSDVGLQPAGLALFALIFAFRTLARAFVSGLMRRSADTSKYLARRAISSVSKSSSVSFTSSAVS